MLNAIMVVLAVFVTGCATHAQREWQRILVESELAKKTMDDCYRPLDATPARQLLQKRFIYDDADPQKIHKLTINDYISAEETAALLEHSAAIQPCRQAALEAVAKVHPAYVVLFANMFADADSAIVKVIQKQLTIGEANQYVLDRRNHYNSEFLAVTQRIQADLNQSHQYEIAQRQQAARALQTWGYQQQMLGLMQQQQMRSQMGITCHHIGNMTHCN